MYRALIVLQLVADSVECAFNRRGWFQVLACFVLRGFCSVVPYSVVKKMRDGTLRQ